MSEHSSFLAGPLLSHGYFLRACFVFAALAAGTGVGLEALAAHLPAARLAVANGRDMLHAAADIALWHGIAVCALCLGAKQLHPHRIKLACGGMVLGMVLFCVPVTLMALTSWHVPPLAPFGGGLLMLSWVATAFSALMARRV